MELDFGRGTVKVKQEKKKNPEEDSDGEKEETETAPKPKCEKLRKRKVSKRFSKRKEKKAVSYKEKKIKKGAAKIKKEINKKIIAITSPKKEQKEMKMNKNYGNAANSELSIKDEENKPRILRSGKVFFPVSLDSSSTHEVPLTPKTIFSKTGSVKQTMINRGSRRFMPYSKKDFTVPSPLGDGNLTAVSSLSPKTAVPEKEKDILIFDTEITVNNIDLIKNIKATNVFGGGRPIIYVPWSVLNEMDELKKVKKNFEKVMNIVHYFQAVVDIDPNVKLQSLLELGAWNQRTSAPKDRLIECCLGLGKKYPDHKVILITDDLILSMKARHFAIHQCTSEQLQQQLI